MSSDYVRTMFREAVEDLLTSYAFTFIETINRARAASELPIRWYTLDFPAASSQRIGLGVPSLFRESGSAIVILFTEQQITDATVTAAAEVIREQLTNWRDASGQLRVLDAGPPSDLDGGDFRGAWYGVGVDLRYQFDHFVGASGVLP